MGEFFFPQQFKVTAEDLQTFFHLALRKEVSSCFTISLHLTDSKHLVCLSYTPLPALKPWI
jgi:hypothetical protein